MNVLAMLAAAGAVIALWTGAKRYSGSVARGYRWLGGAALFWLIGLIVDSVLSGPLSSSAQPPGLADVAPLLGLGAAAIGIMVLASPQPGEQIGVVRRVGAARPRRRLCDGGRAARHRLGRGVR